MKILVAPVALSVVLLVLSVAVCAQQPSSPETTPSVTLFQNIRVFDGKNPTLTDPTNVLVCGNTIEKISNVRIPADRSGNTQIINGGGRTLMPGLIDAHWHAMLIRPNPAQAIAGDAGYNNIAAGVEATDTLMRGFTTVRDVGGPVFGLKSAIDSGIIAGPRIFPSGAVITVTSGHGDFRQLPELPRTIGTLSRMEQLGGSMVRRQSRRGAPPRPRATHAGCLPDQADGWRRCFLAVQPDRRVDFHGGGTAGSG
jgi:imidazolonepropionase-like amidohydrolase